MSDIDDDLFRDTPSPSPETEDRSRPLLEEVEYIPGLWLVPGGLPDQVQEHILRKVYRAHPLFLASPETNQSMSFGYELPPYAQAILETLDLADLSARVGGERTKEILEGAYFNQVILNGYAPGQGILPHVDLARFDDIILGASFLSACTMNFAPLAPEVEADGYATTGAAAFTMPVRLYPGDIYVMTGESRWRWTHAIPEREADVVEGHEVLRGTRISITLRRVKS